MHSLYITNLMKSDLSSCLSRIARCFGSLDPTGARPLVDAVKAYQSGDSSFDDVRTAALGLLAPPDESHFGSCGKLTRCEFEEFEDAEPTVWVEWETYGGVKVETRFDESKGREQFLFVEWGRDSRFSFFEVVSALATLNGMGGYEVNAGNGDGQMVRAPMRLLLAAAAIELETQHNGSSMIKCIERVTMLLSASEDNRQDADVDHLVDTLD